MAREELDSESRRGRFVDALDCISDLLISSEKCNTVEPWSLGALMRVMVDEARDLYDEPGKPHAGLRRSND